MELIKEVSNVFPWLLSWVRMGMDAVNEWFGFPISESAIIATGIALIYKIFKR